MTVFVEQVGGHGSWQTTNQSVRDGVTAPMHEQRDRPGSAGGETLPRARRAALLTRVVATEILPRLAMARRIAEGATISATEVVVTTDDDAAELVRLLLSEDVRGAVAFIERLRLRGVPAEALYIGILSQAARDIGHLWEEDRCDFVQVTVSLGRLQQVARALSPSFQVTAVSRGEAYSVLLLPAQGDQHTYGLLILAEFFQRAGWHVDGGPASTIDPVEMVRHTWYDVAGFSIGSKTLIEALARRIRQVRRASTNRHLGVMVGGPLFTDRPELVAMVGADAASADAPGAVQQAYGLVAMRAGAHAR
jgi:methanogenic corrinoid protein MtbC1